MIQFFMKKKNPFKLKNSGGEENILSQPTAPHSPTSNGMAERKNKTLIELTNCHVNWI